MEYARVLIGTDYSDQAMDAARLAQRLGGKDTRYRVVHVAPLAELPGQAPSAGTGRGRLHEWCAEAGVPAPEEIVLSGSPARELVHEAGRSQADLIVIGHTGRGRIMDALLGSTARSVARLSTCDTLIVRGKPPPSQAPPFHDILVATDFHPPSGRAASRASRLAVKSSAALSVVHAVDPDIWSQALHTPPEEFPEAADWLDHTYGQMLHRFNLEHVGGRAKEHLTHGRPAKAIAEQARLQGADLIVVGTHGAQGVERLLLGARAEAIAERAPCSVLIVR